MKICILSILNLKHMSLISLYTDFFDEYGIDYDIIYVDKYNEIEKSHAKNIYKFDIDINSKWNFFKKIKAYYPFRKFAKTIIKNNDYDYIIVWRTETALMFFDVLTRKYKNKYSLNIRDYCFEKSKLIYNLVKVLVKKSDVTTISSEGFKNFLPKSNYLTVHSFNSTVLKEIQSRPINKRALPIKISFIGSVRFLKENRKLMLSLKNDERFLLQYFGQGSEELKKFSEENNIKNVKFHGRFQPSETSKFLENTDIINNIFGNHQLSVKTLVSIRFYYSIYLNKPILVNTGTFMEKKSSEVGIGYAIDSKVDYQLGDKLFYWYQNLDNEKLKIARLAALKKIQSENQIFEEYIESTFSKGGLDS